LTIFEYEDDKGARDNKNGMGAVLCPGGSGRGLEG